MTQRMEEGRSLMRSPSSPRKRQPGMRRLDQFEDGLLGGEVRFGDEVGGAFSQGR